MFLINKNEKHSTFNILRGNEGCGKSYGIFNKFINQSSEIKKEYGDRSVFYICPSIIQTLEKFNNYKSLFGQSNKQQSKNPEWLISKSEILRSIIKTNYPDLYDSIKQGINGEHHQFIYDGFLVSDNLLLNKQSIRFEHKLEKEKELIKYQWKNSSQKRNITNPLAGNYMITTRMLYTHLNEIIKSFEKYKNINGIGLVMIETAHKTNPVAYNQYMDLKIFKNIKRFLKNDLKLPWMFTDPILNKIESDGSVIDPNYSSIANNINESYYESTKPILIDNIHIDKFEVFPGNGNYTNHDNFKIKILFLSKVVLNSLHKLMTETTKRYNNIFSENISDNTNNIFFVDQSNFLHYFKQLNEKSLKKWTDNSVLIFDEFPLLNSPFLTIEELNSASAVYGSKYDNMESILNKIKEMRKLLVQSNNDEEKMNLRKQLNMLKIKLKRKYNKNIEETIKYLDDPELIMNKDMFKNSSFDIVNPAYFQDKNFKAGELLFIPKSEKKNFFNIFYENNIKTFILTTEIIPIEYLTNNFENVNIEDRTSKILNKEETAIAYVFNSEKEYNDILPISKNQDTIREFIKKIKKDSDSILVIANNKFEGDITSTSIKGSNIFIERDKNDDPIKEVHYFISPDNPKALAKTFLKVHGNDIKNEDSVCAQLDLNDELKTKYFNMSVNKLTDAINQTLGRFFGERGKILKEKPKVFIYAYDDISGVSLAAMKNSRYNIEFKSYNENENIKNSNDKIDPPKNKEEDIFINRSNIKNIGDTIYNMTSNIFKLNDNEKEFLMKKINKKIFKDSWKFGFNNIVVNSLNTYTKTLNKLIGVIKECNFNLYEEIILDHKNQLEIVNTNFINLKDKENFILTYRKFSKYFQSIIDPKNKDLDIECILDNLYLCIYIFSIETMKTCLLKHIDNKLISNHRYELLKPTIIENKKLENYSKIILSVYNSIRDQEYCININGNISYCLMEEFSERYFHEFKSILDKECDKQKIDKDSVLNKLKDKLNNNYQKLINYYGCRIKVEEAIGISLNKICKLKEEYFEFGTTLFKLKNHVLESISDSVKEILIFDREYTKDDYIPNNIVFNWNNKSYSKILI